VTPVFQTKFGVNRWPFEPGDCLSACIASILEIPIQEVPGFVDMRDDRDGLWAERLDAWLGPMGLRAICLPAHAVAALPPDHHCIFHGLSVKGHEHAVVAMDGEIVHDPHPSRTGLARVDGVILLALRAPEFVGSDFESFRANAERVLDDIARFRSSLSPHDLAFVQIGLHASHMEEAIVAGDELRAKAHLRALVDLVRRVREGAGT
jgi:hypothetical protein